MKLLKRLLISLATLVVGLGGLVLWCADGIKAPKVSGVEPVEYPNVEARAVDTSTVVVMTYNIAWGFGPGSDGSRGGLETPAKMTANLQAIIDGIKAVDPDILLIQEIDFGAGRSHHVDQMKAIAEGARFRYAAAGSAWEHNYLPFPYWPPKNHWGRMRSGGAILSHHPIVRCRLETLVKPAEQPWWYRLMYIFRYVQRCDVKVGSEVVAVYNAHLEAFSQSNRELHAGRLVEIFQKEMQPNLIFGGDLNTVPPESKTLRGFADEAMDFSNDPTLAKIRGVEGLSDTVPPDVFNADQGRFLTFPGDAPSRKLDYIFVGTAFESTKVWVPDGLGDASDHLPVVAKLRLAR